MEENLLLEPGDRIVVPKSGWNVIQHHAIYLGRNYQGEQVFAENKIGYGVRLVTAESFFKGIKRITLIEKFKGNKRERKLVVERALGRLGIPYQLIDYNCEHFANDVQYLRKESKQVENTILAIFVGLVASALIID